MAYARPTGAIPSTQHDLGLLIAGKTSLIGRWPRLKSEGFRVRALKDGAHVCLLSGNDRDMAAAFPELVAELQTVDTDFAIEGELVVLGDRVPRCLRGRAGVR